MILKHADASTLAVVNATREALPAIKAVAPRGMDLRIDFDQSLFVRAAIGGVLREGVLAAALVSLMILVFLGSWRSTVVVCTSIPLAILTSIVALNLLGHSINIMTLGGLALAIGMLVDDATVEVENIHRNLAMHKPLTVAILDGARQIAVPAIVATLAICIVFFPVVLLVGPARYLFTPLALSVVFAMLASYLLSRTLVPALFRKLLHGQHHHNGPHPASAAARFGVAFNEWRDRHFARFQEGYGRMLDVALHHRRLVLLLLLGFVAVTAALLPIIGTDFFPAADAGIMRLHFRAPSGTRIEETERLVARVEERIRTLVRPRELATINDTIGVPTSYNLAYVQTDNVSSMDAEILVALAHAHRPTEEYMRVLRDTLPREFPACEFYFLPADIVNQVLNFGLSAAIDVQVEAPDFSRSYPLARRLRDAIDTVPGAADVHIVQVLDYPAIRVNVDRVRAAQLGLTERDVANSLLISLSSSALVAPSYFLNPANNVNYIVAVKEPLRLIDSVPSLLGIPVTGPGAEPTPAAAASATSGAAGTGTAQQPAPSPQSDVPRAQAQPLGNIASVRPEATFNSISHYTVQRVLDIAARPDGRDLGAVVSDIEKKIAELGALPAGTRIQVRGQIETMRRSFRLLGLGLLLAIALVYLLMVVLFQSFVDPFIIMMAVPGALLGVPWMLALSGTTINVESLMGSIMAVGIAVSNSILLVSFANDRRAEQEDLSPVQAASEAGRTRLRPVLMTALAMLLGMLPMALGIGEGGEQNAPLGRAVIGGLLLATLMTLFAVPVAYSLLRRDLPEKHVLEKDFLLAEKGAAPDEQPGAGHP